MKRILLSLVMIAGLAACSTPPVSYETDQAKVDAVERAAMRGGVRIIWLNAPQKAARGS